MPPCFVQAAHRIRGGDDAAEADWVKLGESVDLAFDHADILATARHWLAQGLVERTLGLDILPPSFDRQDVRALFQELGLSRPVADGWSRRMVRSGAIKIETHNSNRLHLADPAT